MFINFFNKLWRYERERIERASWDIFSRFLVVFAEIYWANTGLFGRRVIRTNCCLLVLLVLASHLSVHFNSKLPTDKVRYDSQSSAYWHPVTISGWLCDIMTLTLILKSNLVIQRSKRPTSFSFIIKGCWSHSKLLLKFRICVEWKQISSIFHLRAQLCAT